MRFVVALVACICLTAPAAQAATPAGGYQQDDGLGFLNILPPGQNGLATLPQIGSFLSGGDRPPHNQDQLGMYRDLIYATPGLKEQDTGKYFKDASFGVRPGDEERTYSPRDDVTIVRDKGFSVPHIYGGTRGGAMFGAGYTTAEDRLFFIDVLRRLGRGQLSSFVGGSPGNRAQEQEQWAIAPYTESDLQRQVDQLDDLYGAEGAQIQSDAHEYTLGVEAYIQEARRDPSKMPGEYAAIGRPAGPEDWKDTDIISIASLVGGIFGKGGGRELDSSLVLQDAQSRFGEGDGTRAWADFRSAEDPEAPTTVHNRQFPYQVPPANLDPASVARPDPGSVKKIDPLSVGGEETSPLGLLPSFFPSSNSNALLVSGKHTGDGHPLAVFGPQVSYFTPQILTEMDIHGPGIDARGAAFPGTNVYVQLGRGRDYAWSATSAGNDIVDTFALDLCDPAGGPAKIDSTGYMYRGQCRSIEALKRTNSWVPSAADQTPPGSETVTAYRTALGLGVARATIGGKPVIYTQLRSTYMHEVDSALGFKDFNDPDKMRGAADFQRAACRIGYTFNWFYADDRDIAYFNSGNNPVRAPGTDPSLPNRGQFEWQGWNPDSLTAQYTPCKDHPQVVNQDYLTSWNNKQAPGYRAADDQYKFQPIYRNQPLDDGILKRTSGRQKITREGLIDAMDDAATVDLRGDKVLPYVLRVLGPQTDPPLADAVTKLTAWSKAGAHRIDRNKDGKYEDSDAVAIMDAWWPKLVSAEFQPTLGDDLYKRIQVMVGLDNEPNNHGNHMGSAYEVGWYGYVQKDLRTILGESVRGRYSRVYCGGGELATCRTALTDSLRQAIAASGDRGTLYKDSHCTGGDAGSQGCFDSISFRALGAITQPLIPWQNRPTFQQAVDIQSHRGRPLARCLERRGRLSRRGAGKLRLGQRGDLLVMRAARSGVTRKRGVLRFCVDGGGAVLAGLDKKGAARLIGATAKGYRLKGVRRGTALRALRRRVRGLRRVGKLRVSKRLVFGVRRGRVSFVAVADRGLVRSHRELQRYVRKSNLR